MREEILCEGTTTMYEHLCAHDIWAKLGMNRRDCSGQVRESWVSTTLRQPTIKEIGLLTPRVAAIVEELGMLDYAHLPLRN